MNEQTDGINLKDSPCNKCPDRVADPNCHITCVRYNRWSEAIREKNRRLSAEAEKNRISDTKRKWLQKKMRRNK